MVAPVSQHDMKMATPMPDMGTGPISVEPYVSAAFFEGEREQIFKHDHPREKV
mgnify:CR=1 FL=1